MKIESNVRQVSVPANRLNITRTASAFDSMLETLEIGAGFDYVTGAKDKAGNDVPPHLKAQYGRAPSSKWAPKGKTFKIFQAEDQDGLVEGLEVRYTVARVPFVEPVKRVTKAEKAAAAAAAAAPEIAASPVSLPAEQGEGSDAE